MLINNHDDLQEFLKLRFGSKKFSNSNSFPSPISNLLSEIEKCFDKHQKAVDTIHHNDDDKYNIRDYHGNYVNHGLKNPKVLDKNINRPATVVYHGADADALKESSSLLSPSFRKYLPQKSKIIPSSVESVESGECYKSSLNSTKNKNRIKPNFALKRGKKRKISSDSEVEIDINNSLEAKKSIVKPPTIAKVAEEIKMNLYHQISQRKYLIVADVTGYSSDEIVLSIQQQSKGETGNDFKISLSLFPKFDSNLNQFPITNSNGNSELKENKGTNSTSNSNGQQQQQQNAQNNDNIAAGNGGVNDDNSKSNNTVIHENLENDDVCNDSNDSNDNYNFEDITIISEIPQKKYLNRDIALRFFPDNKRKICSKINNGLLYISIPYILRENIYKVTRIPID